MGSIFHFASDYEKVNLDLGNKKQVEFIHGELVTDDKKIADKVMGSNLYKQGKIWLADSPISGANKRGRPKTVSGSRGTDTIMDSQESKLLEENEALKKRIAELEAK